MACALRQPAIPYPSPPASHAHVGGIRRLMCYPMGGTIGGVRGDHIPIAPPFVIGESHIEEMVGELGEAVGAGPCSRGS